MQKRIALITDTHLDDKTALDRGAYPRKNLEMILQDITSGSINEIVFTGDIGETATYSWLFDKFRAFGLPFKAIPGNHDHIPEMLKNYHGQASAGAGELYYTDDSNNFFKQVFLDSSAGHVSDVQFSWLEKELDTPKQVIIFIHHPIVGLNSGMDKIYPLLGRDKLNDLLQRCARPVTVFCGHYHMPDKRHDRNVLQYVTPSVAFQINKESQTIDINTNSFGYRVITLAEDKISSQLMICRNGRFLQEPE
jgi:Icc protein